ncbi:MAG: MoxR family ATPase [Chloroflexota bacterium]
MLNTIESIQEALASERYIADRELATIIFLARALQKPVLLEGEPGVGKTEVARALSAVLGARLIRLQCYEGLDATHALYEWNYPRQLLHIRAMEGRSADVDEVERSIFSETYLIKRPLLDAIASPSDVPPVLLIDEIDRADEPFEAFLLEVLSDFQVSIPELGTITAHHRPLVVLTSNRTREIHDALKRRCLYMWLTYPTFEREMEILQARVPEIGDALASQLCRFMVHLRAMDLNKRPGVAETIDWAEALLHLHKRHLDAAAVFETAGVILKTREDLARFDWNSIDALVHDMQGAPTGHG